MACWWPDTSTTLSGVPRQPDLLGKNSFPPGGSPSTPPPLLIHSGHCSPGLFISMSGNFCECSECPFLQCQISVSKSPCSRAPISLCSPFQAQRLSLGFLAHRVYVPCPVCSLDSLGIHGLSFIQHLQSARVPGTFLALGIQQWTENSQSLVSQSSK